MSCEGGGAVLTHALILKTVGLSVRAVVKNILCNPFNSWLHVAEWLGLLASQQEDCWLKHPRAFCEESVCSPCGYSGFLPPPKHMPSVCVYCMFLQTDPHNISLMLKLLCVMTDPVRLILTAKVSLHCCHLLFNSRSQFCVMSPYSY